MEPSRDVSRRWDRPAPGRPLPATAGLARPAGDHTLARLAGLGPAAAVTGVSNAALAGRLGGAERPVLQRDFTVASSISAGGADAYGAADLRVDELSMSDKKRPVTHIKSSQGRHTLAWAARIRYWKAVFAGKTYLGAFKTLEQMAKEDQAVDKEMGATAADAKRGELFGELAGIDDTTSKTASAWTELLTWALTTYVASSQLSVATAFPSIRPKGRGESDRLKTLERANEALAPSKDDEMKLEPPPQGKVKKAARDLVDLHGGLPPTVLWKVFRDWLAMLTVTYPNLFRAGWLKVPPGTAIAQLKSDGYSAAAEVLAQMGIVDDGDVKMKKPVAKEKEEAEETSAEEAEAVGSLTAGGGGHKLGEAEPFVVRVPTSIVAGADTEYEPKQLTVDRITVSDERPPTQFGIKQQSHTIPWSLDRIVWVREFKGPLENVIAALKRRATEEQSWSKDNTRADLKQRRTKLLAALDAAAGEKRNIPGWTRWLDERIEEYVETYEASPFATYGTEPNESGASTPASKGEGPGLKAFKRIDDDIKARAILPEDEYKVRCAEVRRYGAMLVDVPKTSLNLERVDPAKLLARWLEDIKTVFPLIAAQHDGDLRDAFNDASHQSDFYKKLNVDLSATSKRTRDSAEQAKKKIKVTA